MEKKPTLLFTISTFGHGKGGHFYSLHTIAEELSKQFEITIINLGVAQSPILNSLLYKTHFLKFDGSGFFKTFRKIKSICLATNPIMINAFDIESFAFARRAGRKLDLPVFHTKCGGPNPKGYFPIINNLILFSKENAAFFENSSNYKNTTTFVIPNRVVPITQDEERIQSLLEKHNLDPEKETILLRIARIGRHYKTSIEQGVELTKWLNENGFPTKLLLLGEIQEQSIFEEISAFIESKGIRQYVRTEHDKEFTKNASQLLPVASVVIGSGRNFMEATSFGIPVLVTLQNEKFPLQVTPENFAQVFDTNFSPRTKVDTYNQEENLASIQKVIGSDTNSFSTKDWFKEHFSVKTGAIKYAKIYQESAQYEREKRSLDAIKNMFYTILRFRKSKAK